jgi:hypothetical protein
VVAVEDARDRQRLTERLCRQRPLRRADRQQAAAPAPTGQQQRDSAAAEGAEESSAPQAWR